MTSNINKNIVAFEIINRNQSEINKHEDNIMNVRLQLIHNLQNATDASMVYKSIRDTIAYIEDQKRMIDYGRETIINAYEFMMSED